MSENDDLNDADFQRLMNELNVIRSGRKSIFLQSLHLQNADAVCAALCNSRVHEVSFASNAQDAPAAQLLSAVKMLKKVSFTFDFPTLEVWTAILERGTVEEIELYECRTLSSQYADPLARAKNLKKIEWIGRGAASIPELIGSPKCNIVVQSGDAIPSRNEVTVFSGNLAGKFVAGLDVEKSRLEEIFFKRTDVADAESFVSRYRKLKSVFFDGMNGDENIFQHLEGYDCLKELGCFLKTSQKEQADVKLVSKLLRTLKNLNSLCLNVFNVCICEAAESLGTITTLELFDCVVDGEHLIRAFSGLPALSTLQMSHVNLQPESAWPSVIAAFPRTITDLYFETNDTPWRMQLLTVLKLPRLKRLDWKDCVPHTTEEVESLRVALQACHTLRHVVLYGHSFSDETLLSFVSVCSAKIFWQFCASSVSIDQNLSVQRNCIIEDRAHWTVSTLLWVRKRRKTFLNYLLKDLVTAIAKELWESRGDADAWWDNWKR